MNKYLVVVEETETGYSSYSPDIPGCVAAGATQKEVERTMREAIEFHLEGMKCDGGRSPAPHSYSMYCEVPA